MYPRTRLLSAPDRSKTLSFAHAEQLRAARGTLEGAFWTFSRMLGGCLAERVLTPGSRTFLGVQDSSERPRSGATLHCLVVKSVVWEQPNRRARVAAVGGQRRSKNLTVKEENGKLWRPLSGVLSVGGGKAAPRWTAEPRVFREITWDNLASQIDILLTKQTTHVLHATSPHPPPPSPLIPQPRARVCTFTSRRTNS